MSPKPILNTMIYQCLLTYKALLAVSCPVSFPVSCRRFLQMLLESLPRDLPTKEVVAVAKKAVEVARAFREVVMAAAEIVVAVLVAVLVAP